MSSSTALSSFTAYLLVIHGSRDPRSQQGAIALSQKLLADFLPAPIGTAVLELGPVPLHQQILNFIQQVPWPSEGGLKRLKILPLFLLPGVHVMEDIPAEVAEARRVLGKGVRRSFGAWQSQSLPQSAIEPEVLPEVLLEVLPHWGSQEAAMEKLLQSHSPSSKQHPHDILMAHGSNRPGATVPIEALAQRLGMRTAYWVQPDSLLEQIQAILAETDSETDAETNAETDSAIKTATGHQPKTIAILPYFLFEGGITDAIAQRLEALGPQFPNIRFRLGPTLSALPGFSQLVQTQLVQTQPLQTQPVQNPLEPSPFRSPESGI